MSFLAGSTDASKPRPPERPSLQGRGSAAAPAGAETGGRSPQPCPALLRPRTARPPGPGARPAAPRCAVPPPARPRLPGALQSAHTSARGPFLGHPQRRRGRSPLGQRGGAGGGPGRRRPLLPGPAPARAPARLRAPGQPSAPGAGPNPPCPPARSPSGALRPAPPRAAPPPLASPPPARLRAAPCRKRRRPGPPGGRPAIPAPPPGPSPPLLPEKGKPERGRKGAGPQRGRRRQARARRAPPAARA